MSEASSLPLCNWTRSIFFLSRTRLTRLTLTGRALSAQFTIMEADELAPIPWAPLAAPDAGGMLLVKCRISCDKASGCAYSLCVTDCARVWVASSTDSAAIEAELRSANPHLECTLEQAANIAREALCSPAVAPGRPLRAEAVRAERRGDGNGGLRLVITRQIGFYTFTWPFVLRLLGTDAQAELLRTQLIEPLLLLSAHLSAALSRLHVAPPELPAETLALAAHPTPEAVALGSDVCQLYGQLMRARSGAIPGIYVRSTALDASPAPAAIEAAAAAAATTTSTETAATATTTATVTTNSITESELELKRRREIEERLQRQREAKEQKVKKRKIEFV